MNKCFVNDFRDRINIILLKNNTKSDFNISYILKSIRKTLNNNFPKFIYNFIFY